MRRSGMGHAVDWLMARVRLKKETGLPPGHLLRQTFEQARDFQDAKQMLAETPVCAPVIFILAGTQNGEGCVIERLETKAAIREIGDRMQVAAANDFESDLKTHPRQWQPRPVDSAGRRRQIACLDHTALEKADFAYLEYPMRNPFTRIAMVADAGHNRLKLQGFEKDGPVTEIFALASELDSPSPFQTGI